MSERERLVLDVDFETARAIHRVVRGMHDGECPKCHRIVSASLMEHPDGGRVCTACGFYISRAEMQAAMRVFAPVMERNLEVFERWRNEGAAVETAEPQT
jgi:hypothetical protein